MPFLRTRLSLLAYVIPCLWSSYALSSGTVEGRVSDQSGEIFFDGALIQLTPESGPQRYETQSNHGGRFIINGLPAGRYTLTVEYAGTDSVSESIIIVDDQTTSHSARIGQHVQYMENMIVVGQAAGSLRALNQRRNADNVIAVVNADAIGQLPDENVSEALQRINGVFIERDQGEGRFVGVRGISPTLNVATVNGLTIPSPEGGRRDVALDVIPSDLVESLSVSKTLTPDQDGDAIGGSISINSLSAFDRAGFSGKITAQSYYNAHESDDGYKLAGSFSNIFTVGNGELGIAFSASTNERNFGTDNIESGDPWVIEDGNPPFQESLEMRDYQITRERDGLSLNVEYRPSESTRIYLNSLRSEFSDQEFRNRAQFNFDDGDITQLDTGLIATDLEISRDMKDRLEEQVISSTAIGGEWFVDDWTFELMAGLSKAEEEESGRIDSEFINDSVAEASYQGFSSPSISYSEDGAMAENFVLEELVLEDNYTEDEENVVKFDITRAISGQQYNGMIKFGGKIRQREKFVDVNSATYEGITDASGNPLTLSSFSTSLDYNYGNFGPGINASRIRQFAADNIASNIACQIDTYDEDLCPAELDEDNTLLDSARDAEFEEDVTSVYVMSRMDWQDWRVVYGLRYEQTDFSANGFVVREVDVEGQDSTQIQAQNLSDDYSQLLPSINVRFKYSDNLLFRAAYTESLARPSFGDLTPTPDEIEIEENDGEIEASIFAGNTNLEPYESQNVDFTMEYYPEHLGNFYAGLFYKNIENFIFPADVSSIVDVSQFTGNIPITEAQIIQPRNGNAADLYGVELGWMKQFSALPSPFDGFLISANATLTDSDADLGLTEDAERSSSSALPLQADTVANLTLGYEKGNWSVRLSSAYVGKRLAEINFENSDADAYNNSRHQIDLSVRYDITDHLQMYLNGINLNEETEHTYYGQNRRLLKQRDEIGTSYVLGVSYRL
ncbi:TonB-dependent receptor [Marinibactrum halimedae]|uniref:TonB-dependent receptor n=1 Tax=Marinibactrum halimedae TaxID=1444977 RepID=A0AA37TCF1_9GAMM|nr:TonB-dependent receptor [Marinibactrum halimedae]MCD9461008.1 TonB-dependent receptor [Marinibactrum halimedae]GLS27806.1 TonB-dependent receptor [Marinibactrum halimedae]